MPALAGDPSEGMGSQGWCRHRWMPGGSSPQVQPLLLPENVHELDHLQRQHVLAEVCAAGPRKKTHEFLEGSALPATPRPQPRFPTSPRLTLQGARGQRSVGRPGPLTVPVLKDDAHAAVAARLLGAVHDPQRLHLGVHEGAPLHTAGRGRSAGLRGLCGGGEACGGSPDFGQQDAGVERGLQVGEGLQVGLLAHAQVHQLLGLGLGALLGAHLDKVVQGLQFAQRLPLAGEREASWAGQEGQAPSLRPAR